MHNHYEGTRLVTVRGGVRERPTTARYSSAAAAGQSIRRIVPPEHGLPDQVRNLRIALSDLKIQVSDLAAKFGRV